jgi:hypothetical protein
MYCTSPPIIESLFTTTNSLSLNLVLADLIAHVIRWIQLVLSLLYPNEVLSEFDYMYIYNF